MAVSEILLRPVWVELGWLPCHMGVAQQRISQLAPQAEFGQEQPVSGHLSRTCDWLCRYPRCRCCRLATYS